MSTEMRTKQDVVCEFLEDDLSYDEAIDDLIALGLTAMEAERIIDEVSE